MNSNKDEQDYLNMMRAFTTDTGGREVLVGLNFDETEEYRQLQSMMMAGIRCFKGSGREWHCATERYRHLNEKHETLRHAVVGAEYELKILNSTRN